jgi:hypothetical protein
MRAGVGERRRQARRRRLAGSGQLKRQRAISLKARGEHDDHNHTGTQSNDT